MAEKFLVLEIAPQRTRGVFLRIDEDRNIHFEKITTKPVQEFIQALGRRRALAKKMPRGAQLLAPARRVIAAVDPSLATTVPVPLELERDQANLRTKITLAELENLVAQALAKIFNGCRNEAARRLSENELDAVLVGATALDFQVDGVPVRNPVGVAGRRIFLLLELVFTNRRLFETLKPLFNKEEGREPFFFAEAPQTHLRAISRSRGLPLNLVSAGPRGTDLYVFMKAKGEYPVLYREKLNWNFRAFTDALREAFALGDGAADGLYCLYHRGAMSQAALRTFKKTLEPALTSLIKELERAKVAGPVYVDAPHPLPLPLPYRNGPVIFDAYPAAEILDGLGFTLPSKGRHAAAVRGEAAHAHLRPLLYFLEAYFDRNDAAINRKLQRRLHWLAEP